MLGLVLATAVAISPEALNTFLLKQVAENFETKVHNSVMAGRPASCETAIYAVEAAYRLKEVKLAGVIPISSVEQYPITPKDQLEIDRVILSLERIAEQGKIRCSAGR